VHLHEQAFQASKLANYAYDRMGRVEIVYFMGVDTVSLVDARVTTSHESCKVCVHRCVSIVCEHRECGKLVYSQVQETDKLSAWVGLAQVRV